MPAGIISSACRALRRGGGGGGQFVRSVLSQDDTEYERLFD